MIICLDPLRSYNDSYYTTPPYPPVGDVKYFAEFNFKALDYLLTWFTPRPDLEIVTTTTDPYNNLSFQDRADFINNYTDGQGNKIDLVVCLDLYFFDDITRWYFRPVCTYIMYDYDKFDPALIANVASEYSLMCNSLLTSIEYTNRFPGLFYETTLNYLDNGIDGICYMGGDSNNADRMYERFSNSFIDNFIYCVFRSINIYIASVAPPFPTPSPPNPLPKPQQVREEEEDIVFARRKVNIIRR